MSQPSLKINAPSAAIRLSLSVSLGAIVAILLIANEHLVLAPLVGWDVTALTYFVWTWLTIWPMGPEQTAALSKRENPGRVLADVVLTFASLASLVAVGAVILQASTMGGASKFLQAGLGVLSVVLSWMVVHTLFALRYARIYYTEPKGGVSFNQKEEPSYSDFAYLAFTIGMTFQVSDTAFETPDMRGTALRHALLSYLFGTVIVATTINLIAGLNK